MLCQKCKKNEATVYYKENINGHVTEYNLCPECAAELEKNGVLHLDSHAEDLFGERMFDFSPLISGFFGGALGTGKTEKRCPVCGSTFADIAKSGHIGCPECYNVFEKELSSTVNQLHGAAKPTGRSPKRFGEKHQREEKIAALKAELQKAIGEQAFEHAAELRDEIKALENESAECCCKKPAEAPATEAKTEAENTTDACCHEENKDSGNENA